MTDLIKFPSATARYELPLLHVAQAQKELFVNEAMVRTDVLLQPAVMGSMTVPPSNPDEGECWIVANDASGTFEGHEDTLACWQQGQWLFVEPLPGLRVFDRSTGSDRRYDGVWSEPSAVTPASGGSTVDQEARAAIAAIITALQAAGTLPAS